MCYLTRHVLLHFSYPHPFSYKKCEDYKQKQMSAVNSRKKNNTIARPAHSFQSIFLLILLRYNLGLQGLVRCQVSSSIWLFPGQYLPLTGLRQLDIHHFNALFNYFFSFQFQSGNITSMQSFTQAF